MEPITVKATCCLGHWIMRCTDCGPLGVSPDKPDAMMVAERHLAIHGTPQMMRSN